MAWNTNMQPPWLNEKQVRLFLAQVDQAGADECWGWLACCIRGYGSYGWIAGPYQRRLGAHRVAYLLETGEWPELLMHDCNNPKCCNPAHLRPGSHQLNMRQMASDGRACRGARSPHAKMTSAEVRLLVHLWRNGTSKAECARRFGVSHKAVRLILSGKNWAWLNVV